MQVNVIFAAEMHHFTPHSLGDAARCIHVAAKVHVLHDRPGLVRGLLHKALKVSLVRTRRKGLGSDDAVERVVRKEVLVISERMSGSNLHALVLWRSLIQT